jgi:TRAP-type C4-dicarboxylate transport system permease small subunit
MPAKSVSGAGRRLDRCIFITTWATAGATIIAMFFVVVTLVIARYVAKAPFFWGEELARYTMFYMVMIGSAVAVREDRHLRLTLLIEAFPPALKRWWDRLLDLCVLAVLAVMVYQGLDLAREDGGMMTPALRIAYFWIYIGFPIGTGLMLIQLIAKNLFTASPPD